MESILPGKMVIAFDLYGTLLSTESIAQELAGFLGEDEAKVVSALWRRYQLEYTWRINSMGIYRPFSEVTRGALRHAAAERGHSLSEDQTNKLLEAYDSLHVFPEVPKALEHLRSKPAIEACVFTNGTDAMVSASVQSSPDLGPYKDVFRRLITVEDLKAFKPDAAVYGDLVEKVGKAGNTQDVWVVSANPFDVVGARAAGLQAAWVDRAGTGWVDRLGEVIGGIEPTIVVTGVDEVVAKITSISSV